MELLESNRGQDFDFQQKIPWIPEEIQVCSTDSLAAAAARGNALSPMGSAGSTLTLEELDNLMLCPELEEEEQGGGGGTVFGDTAGSMMMKELENLIYSSPIPPSGSSGGRDDCSSSLDCMSIESWTSGMLTGEEEGEEATSSDSAWSPNLEGAKRQSSGLSDRSNLITLLQQCIASHLIADNTKSNSKSSESERDTTKRKRQRSQSPRIRVEVPRDIMSLLHDCAHAVAARDVANANSLAVTIRGRHGAAPHAADARQRVAYYFVESLMARAFGTGAALAAAAPPAEPHVMDEVYHFRLRATPSPLLPHFFSTQAILDAFEGRSVVHIVEIGLARNRFQWSLLLQALARRREGPPKRLRITAIDSPQNGRVFLQQLGHRIVEEAGNLGIHAEMELQVGEAYEWEWILARIACRDDPYEALVVNSLFALDFLEDETATQARSPRRAVLSALHAMEPDAVVLGVNHSHRAAPHFSFLERFAQAVTRFAAKFDAAMHCGGELPEGRAAYEGRFLAPEILNLVACDGLDRVVRTAPYDEWHRVMIGAGFQVLPIDGATFRRAQAMMDGYDRRFEMEQTDGWMKLSWNKVTTQCVSAWRPRRRH